jgi:hypothetical protein
MNPMKCTQLLHFLWSTPTFTENLLFYHILTRGLTWSKLNFTWSTPGCYPNFFFSHFSIYDPIWVNFLQKIFMSYYFVFPFAYNSLYIIFKSIILLGCLNILFISLVIIESSCKTYVETDLALLHYVTFIESLAICPMEALYFDSDQFTKNSIVGVNYRG